MLELDLGKTYSSSKIRGKIPRYLSVPFKGELCRMRCCFVHKKLFDIVFVSFQPPLQSYGCLKMVNQTRAERLPLWDLTWLMWVAIACWLRWNCAWDWFGVVLNWTIGLFWGLHRFFYWLLQSSQVKRTPQNSALMNLLCEKWIPKSLPQPVLNSNLHSCMSD